MEGKFIGLDLENLTNPIDFDSHIIKMTGVFECSIFILNYSELYTKLFIQKPYD